MSNAKIRFKIVLLIGTFFCSNQVFGQITLNAHSPTPLQTNAASDGKDDSVPVIATDSAGNWIAVWTVFDPPSGQVGSLNFYSRSEDDGMTWSEPQRLDLFASPDTYNEFDCEITTDRHGTWMAVWPTRFDVLVARSTNNGKTWTVPIGLSQFKDTTVGNPQIETDEAGNWIVAWTTTDNLFNTISFDNDILVSRSSDNGTTWSAAEPLNNTAMSDVDDDWITQISTNRTGTWLAVWQTQHHNNDTYGNEGDVFVARSTDNGVTWSDPQPLNTNATFDTGEDRAPRISTDNRGNWLAVWQSTNILADSNVSADWEINFSRSTNDGLTWSSPSVLNNINLGGVHPQIISNGSNSWIALWVSRDTLDNTIGSDRDILMASSNDNGRSWTESTVFNTNADSDTGSDNAVRLVTDRRGNGIAVWMSNDTFGETIGTDDDIWFTRIENLAIEIPTVSQWGLLIITLLMLTSGTILILKQSKRQVFTNIARI